MVTFIKEVLRAVIKDILLTFIFAIVVIGVPIGMLAHRYQLYKTDEGSITIYFVIAALIGGLFVKFLLKAWIYSWELRWYKKLAWGVEQVLPLLLSSGFIYWVTNNAEFVQSLLIWTSVSNTFSYLVAPSYVLKFKEGSKE